jgi:hypothetical protein
MSKRNTRGYIVHRLPSHPLANANGYVPEHWLVVEKTLGHLVDFTKEEVHHIDGHRDNNDPANLQVVTKAEHRRIHAGWRKVGLVWVKTCKSCSRTLAANTNNFFSAPGRSGGLQSRCKSCHLASKRKQVLQASNGNGGAR